MDPLGLKDPDKIESTVNLVHDTYTYVLKSQGKAFKVSGFDSQALKNEIIAKNFDNWKAVEIFIKERLSECIEVVEKSTTSFFPNGSAFSNISLTSFFTDGSAFSNISASGVVVTVIALAAVAALVWCLFGATVDSTASVSKVQDSEIKLNQGAENKVDAVYGGTQANLDFTEEAVQLHQNQADLGEKLIEGSTALASQLQGLEGCAQFIVSGDTGAVVVYLLDLSRAQGLIPPERLAAIKTAADAAFAIVKEKQV